MLTLHGTDCLHRPTSVNLRKNEIHLLYLHFDFTSFLFIIYEVLIKILQNKRQRKSYKPTCLVITFNKRQSNVTSANQRVTSCERV